MVTTTNGTYSYAWEKFMGAILYMMSSEDPTPVKLAKAFTGGIILLKTEEMPPETRVEFSKLYNALTKSVPDPDDKGTVAVVCSQMDYFEVKQHVERILSLYSYLAKYTGIYGDTAN